MQKRLLQHYLLLEHFKNEESKQDRKMWLSYTQGYLTDKVISNFNYFRQKLNFTNSFFANSIHITCRVFIFDGDSGLYHDSEVWLEKLAPEKSYSHYMHNCYEDNADAHIKRTIMGREIVVAFTGSRMDFGPWKQIFYSEFDVKRRKRVLVIIIGD